MHQTQPNRFARPKGSLVVRKNRWRDAFDGTLPDDWEPHLSVSVVIAAYNSATLPLTLASLAAQDYPADLLEVIVVDDGSEPPVTLGPIVPKRVRLIRVPADSGWGRSNATDLGIRASTGDIIYWVDSDMVLFRDNVRQHAKWAHFIPEAATIGWKGFVESWDFSPEAVFEEVTDGRIAERYDPAALHEHWSLEVFRRTDDLNDSDGRNYSTHMGACATVTRAVYERTNGQDTRLRLGEDTEIAYQLWQAGAVFIPAAEARSWHLGRATVQDHGASVTRYNDVHFAQRMPIPRYRRRAQNRIWEVPLIRAVVEVDLDSARFARQCVDRILNSTLFDVQVDLVGPWSTLEEGRRSVLADPLVELRLVREWFRADSRVRLVETSPDTVFPAPYRVDVPVTVGLESGALQHMYRHIDTNRLGAVRYAAPGLGNGTSVTIWDTAAVNRAKPLVEKDTDLYDWVDVVWGVSEGDLQQAGMVDLRIADLDAAVEFRDPRIAELGAKVSELGAKAAAQRARARTAEGELKEALARLESAESSTLVERLSRAMRRGGR